MRCDSGGNGTREAPSIRGAARIVLFEPDTHGDDWTNSPLFFDVASLTWTRAYPDDPPSTYAVTAEGLPVAGVDGRHPWATHTFAAVTYDAANDRPDLSRAPRASGAGRFTVMRWPHLRPRIRRHPTWLFELGPERWQALDPPDVHFFAYATAYDSDRAVVIGHRPGRCLRAPGARSEIQCGAGRPGASQTGYHIERRLRRAPAAHRARRRQPALQRDRRLRSCRAPGLDDADTRARARRQFEHPPMAFHERKGVTVVLVDRPADATPPIERRPGRTRTWLYDATTDAWSELPGADLPFFLRNELQPSLRRRARSAAAGRRGASRGLGVEAS